MLTIGSSGTGKSTFLRSFLLQDLAREGVALLDPHGDLVESVVRFVREERQRDLVYLNVPDPSCKFTFNPLAGIPPGRRPLTAAGIVETFKKLSSENSGPRLEHRLRNVVLTLVVLPDASSPRLLRDRDWCRSVTQGLTNQAVREFWASEHTGYAPVFRAVVTAPLLNKVGGFLSDPRLAAILSAPSSSVDLRAVID